MDYFAKQALSALAIILIFFCIRRQKRYWRELKKNTPSGSVRAGYAAALLAMSVTLIAVLTINTPEAWKVFLSVVALSCIFCVKITFSPAAIALTLAICTVKLQFDQSFPLMEVWSSILRIVTWRLPENVRAWYNFISFFYVLFILLFPSKSLSPVDTTLDTASEALSL